LRVERPNIDDLIEATVPRSYMPGDAAKLANLLPILRKENVLIARVSPVAANELKDPLAFVGSLFERTRVR
jgi:hypothetical protein